MKLSSLRHFIRNRIRIYSFSDVFWILLSRIEKKRRKFKISERILESAFFFFCFKNSEILREFTRFGNKDKKKGFILIFLRNNPHEEKAWLLFFFHEKELRFKKKILKSFIYFFPGSPLGWRLLSILIGIEFNDVTGKNLWTFFKKNLWLKINFFKPYIKSMLYKLKKIKKFFIQSMKTKFFTWIASLISIHPNFGLENCDGETFSIIKSRFCLYYSPELNFDYPFFFPRLAYLVSFRNQKIREEQDIGCLFLAYEKNKMVKKFNGFNYRFGKELLYGRMNQCNHWDKSFYERPLNWLTKFSEEIFFSYQPFSIVKVLYLFKLSGFLKKGWGQYISWFFLSFLNQLYFSQTEMVYYFKKAIENGYGFWNFFKLTAKRRGMVEKVNEIF